MWQHLTIVMYLTSYVFSSPGKHLILDLPTVVSLLDIFLSSPPCLPGMAVE